MIQFILDNNEFIIYVFMALSFIFLVMIYYQYDRDGNMITPVVGLFCSLFIFFFLVLATGANYPVSGGHGNKFTKTMWMRPLNFPIQMRVKNKQL